MSYFVIEDYMAQSAPNLAITKGGVHVSKNKAIPRDVDLVVGAVGNVHDEPTLFDWHWTPHPIVSQKIRAVLEPLRLYQIEFHDVELALKGYRGPPYSLLRIRNRPNVFDAENSNFEKGASGDILTINRLVLDDMKLKNIAADKRRLFTLTGRYEVIADEGVASTLEGSGATGFKAIPIEEWHSWMNLRDREVEDEFDF